jgi:hypothetical protein
MQEKTDRDFYTRVTHVLYPFSGLDKIDPAVVAHAAQRGTKVHKICEAIIQGLGELGVEEETAPYVESSPSRRDSMMTTSGSRDKLTLSYAPQKDSQFSI